jgi:two-component system sensor histidine kinase CpxA
MFLAHVLRANLFLKLFLWFWLIVVLVGVTLEISTFMIRRDEQKWSVEVSSLLPAEALKAADVLERSGKAALEEYLADLERRHAVRCFLFDEDGHALAGQAPPAIVVAVVANAEEAAAMDAPALSARDGVAARRVTAGSGRHYTLALRFPRSPIHTAWLWFGRSPAWRLITLMLTGGVLSFALARHITRPLLRLREAAGRIADGRFETRVTPELGSRRDEIAWLARDFDQMAERLQGLVMAQRRLLGDVSHELRSPLARMVVALGILRQCPPEEAAAYCDRIKRETDRLDRLIGQLLMLTRLETGADGSLRESFDLRNLVEEIVADGDFEGRARDRRVECVSADACSIIGLMEPLRSAIENVVRNALRYAPASTAVEVTLECTDQRAVLRVRDHGPGVPEELLLDIFRPFQRAAHDASDRDGAGLGLAITERVIQMHEGRVWAYNPPGGGLAVEIELPA